MGPSLLSVYSLHYNPQISEIGIDNCIATIKIPTKSEVMVSIFKIIKANNSMFMAYYT